MYIQLTIGRNASPAAWAWLTEPVALEAHKWAAFQKITRMTLADVLLDAGWSPIETHYGVGSWDGVEEESAHISAYHPQPLWVRRLNPFYRRNMRKLERSLAAVAFQYGQEAIAVVTGDSKLIEGS